MTLCKNMYLLICLYLVDNLLPQTVDGWLTMTLPLRNQNSQRKSTSVDAVAELSLMLVAVAQHH